MATKIIAFTETQKAIDRIKKLAPKLSESEKRTLELLLDKEALVDLEASLKDAREGRVISLEKIRKHL